MIPDNIMTAQLLNVPATISIAIFHTNNYYGEICKGGVCAPVWPFSHATTECAFAKWSQTNERDVGAAAAARIVRRFHRQVARANLHCGGTFRVGVGCIRVVIHRHFMSTPETSIHPVCVARGLRETNNRAECFKRMICAARLHSP